MHQLQTYSIITRSQIISPHKYHRNIIFGRAYKFIWCLLCKMRNIIWFVSFENTICIYEEVLNNLTHTTKYGLQQFEPQGPPFLLCRNHYKRLGSQIKSRKPHWWANLASFFMTELDCNVVVNFIQKWTGDTVWYFRICIEQIIPWFCTTKRTF